MIKTVTIVCVILTAMSVFSAQERGGGNALVCRSSDGAIKSAEMLDLFEGRVEYGLNIVNTKEDPQVRARALLNKMIQAESGTGNRFEELTATFENALKDFWLLEPGVAVEPIDDSLPNIIPKNCKIEQLASYLSTGKLIVDSEIWDHFDETSRTGFYLHESIYKFMRTEYSAKDSRRSRAIVANLMSGVDFIPILKNISVQNNLYCAEKNQFQSNKVSFYVDLSSDISTISMSTMFGQAVISQRAFLLQKEFFYNQNWVLTQLLKTSSVFEGDDEVALGRSAGQLFIYIQKAFGDSATKREQIEIECWKTCFLNGQYIGYCKM